MTPEGKLQLHYDMTQAGLGRLATDEGTILHVYWDGTGEIIEPDPVKGNPTIGTGRNVGKTGPGISEQEAAFLFSNDVLQREAKIIAALPWIVNIPPVWRDVITMVDFNTGNVLGWPTMLRCMEALDSEGAVNALLNSRAAEQLPERYARMADAIRNQTWAETTQT